MKNYLMHLNDKLLARKRSIIETIIDPSGSPVAHGGFPQDRTGLTNAKIFLKSNILGIARL
jgi:hypothetical protein